MQPLRLALVGKGGSGKSTVAGSLARLLSRQGHKTLALDSDPMPGLAISLGLGDLKDAMLAGAVEKDLNGRWKLKPGIGGARAVSRFAMTAPDDVRFIQFGKADSGGLNSIFPSVTGFGQMVHRIARDNVMRDWTIVGDLSAGTRQTAYDWAPYADTYLIVVEPSWKSVLTGRRIARLAANRGARRIWLIANKTESEADDALVAERMAMEPVIAIRKDDAILEADQKGGSVLDLAPSSHFVNAVEDLAAQLQTS